MDYKQAIARIVARRRAELAAFDAACTEAMRNDADYYRAEATLRALELDAVRGKRISQAQRTAARQAKAAAERRLGLIPPPPHCAKCGDSGRVDGKPCACAVSLTIAAADESGIPLHDFTEADFALFDEQARPRIQKTYDNVQTILSAYPGGKKRNIVLMGATGTGKTYLAGCAAAYLLARGESVLTLTAFALNNRFLKYHTTFDGGKADYLDPVVDCSLLVIDDLGTESILKNVTLEYLYQIVNERTLRGKLTLLTTNLPPDGLLSRYGERVYSRLFDKQLCYATVLVGKDLRSSL